MKEHFSALDWTPQLPRQFDDGAMHRFWEAFEAKAGDNDAQCIAINKALIGNVVSCSPYLGRLCIRYPDFLKTALSAQQSTTISLIESDLNIDDIGVDNYLARISTCLRNEKSRIALAVGLNDLAGRWSTMDAAYTLSSFAKSAIDAALGAAWMAHPATIGTSPVGLTVIGMGKLGAGELNYSSDIDLIALFDPDIVTITSDKDVKKTCIDVVRQMVALLNDQTADGYVFRTDLRLRPDPGVSAIVISSAAAEHYYEVHGQNWERAAFIKAIPVAGDLEMGKNFLQTLRPFVWRRNLDFAAIADIHKVREKIAAAHGDTESAVQSLAGHNVKLGIGGIREIEFFVQTHQLVAAGKVPSLRCRGTLEALVALTKEGFLDADNAENLRQAYIYFRFVEHRLQMIDDQQTHSLPEDEHDLQRVTALCGFDDIHSFKAVHRNAMQITRDAYRGLFVKSSARMAIKTNESQQPEVHLDFSGSEPVAQTLQWLSQLGFQSGRDIDRLIRKWLRGDYRATRVARSKTLIDRFLPSLLIAMGRASDPDRTFLAFDRFLSTLPAGVQLFSLFDHNPDIFDNLLSLITISPRLADEFSRHPHYVETLIAGGASIATDRMFFERRTIEQRLEQRILAENTDDLEALINGVANGVTEEQFSIAAALAQAQMSPDEAALRFSNIADATLAVLIPKMQAAMADQYGILDGQLCVLGFGRLGTRRMTFASDIDIVFVYDVPVNAHASGNKPIDATMWYGRMVRRIVTALSAGARHGAIYPVDMQLRPSGGAGPTAVRLSAFSQYYRHEAWIWEMMALTKARVVNHIAQGDDIKAGDLAAKIDRLRIEALSRERDRADVAQAVIQMRNRLAEEKPARSLWDRKSIQGGLTEIEFILQFLTLTSAHEVGLPPVSPKEQPAFFEHTKYLTTEQSEILSQALVMNEHILQLARLGGGAIFSPHADGEALTARILTACGAQSLHQAETILAETQKEVFHLFKTLVS